MYQVCTKSDISLKTYSSNKLTDIARLIPNGLKCISVKEIWVLNRYFDEGDTKNTERSGWNDLRQIFVKRGHFRGLLK